MVINMRAV